MHLLNFPSQITCSSRVYLHTSRDHTPKINTLKVHRVLVKIFYNIILSVRPAAGTPHHMNNIIKIIIYIYIILYDLRNIINKILYYILYYYYHHHRTRIAIYATYIMYIGCRYTHMIYSNSNIRKPVRFERFIIFVHIFYFFIPPARSLAHSFLFVIYVTDEKKKKKPKKVIIKLPRKYNNNNNIYTYTTRPAAEYII